MGPESAQRDLPSYKVLSEDIPLQALPQLYKAADCFVLPTRGEGWGRPHVEAMAMGLPVIATNWSGSTAFLHENVSFPLPIDRLEMVSAEGLGSLDADGHRWAEPSLTSLSCRAVCRAFQFLRHIEH